MGLDHVSLATTPVVAVREGAPAWQGSGFFYLMRDADRQVLFLVTSVHVLTGRAPDDARAPLAESIVFQFHLDPGEPSAVRPIRVPLETRAGHRVWLQSEAVPAADVAVLPIPAHLCEGLRVHCLDAGWSRVVDLDAVVPATPVQFAGFAFGRHDRRNALPAWQTGRLASEATVNFEGEPRVLVELPVLPGMSGAPALLAVERRGPAGEVSVARHLLGVYASLPLAGDGRYPEAHCDGSRAGSMAPAHAPWGHVWRASFVETLVAGVDTDRWEREVLADLAAEPAGAA